MLRGGVANGEREPYMYEWDRTSELIWSKPPLYMWEKEALRENAAGPRSRGKTETKPTRKQLQEPPPPCGFSSCSMLPSEIKYRAQEDTALVSNLSLKCCIYMYI